MRTNFSTHLDVLSIKRADLAKKAGVPVSVISAMEAGEAVQPEEQNAVWAGLSALRLKAYSAHERQQLMEESVSSREHALFAKVRSGEGYVMNVGDSNVVAFVEKNKPSY